VPGRAPEPLRAVIYDLDGLLIDSERCWEQAEMEVLRSVGVPLTSEQCHETTGLRLDEAVAYWASRHPWTGVSLEEVVRRILERVLALLAERAPVKPGVRESLGVFHRAGLRVALASSSPLVLIEGALDRVGLRSAFEQVVSAEGERFGKPHPGVYLTTAARLGVAPESCLARSRRSRRCQAPSTPSTRTFPRRVVLPRIPLSARMQLLAMKGRPQAVPRASARAGHPKLGPMSFPQLWGCSSLDLS